MDSNGTWAFLFLALLLASAFAGCIGPSEPADASPASADGDEPTTDPGDESDPAASNGTAGSDDAPVKDDGNRTWNETFYRNTTAFFSWSSLLSTFPEATMEPFELQDGHGNLTLHADWNKSDWEVEVRLCEWDKHPSFLPQNPPDTCTTDIAWKEGTPPLNLTVPASKLDFDPDRYGVYAVSYDQRTAFGVGVDVLVEVEYFTEPPASDGDGNAR